MRRYIQRARSDTASVFHVRGVNVLLGAVSVAVAVMLFVALLPSREAAWEVGTFLIPLSAAIGTLVVGVALTYVVFLVRAPLVIAREERDAAVVSERQAVTERDALKQRVIESPETRARELNASIEEGERLSARIFGQVIETPKDVWEELDIRVAAYAEKASVFVGEAFPMFSLVLRDRLAEPVSVGYQTVYVTKDDGTQEGPFWVQRRDQCVAPVDRTLHILRGISKWLITGSKPPVPWW